MKAGTFVLIAIEIGDYLKTQGYITATGDFDDAKFNDIPTDLALAAAVEGILKKYGVAVPGKVDQILQLLPLLSGLFK